MGGGLTTAQQTLLTDAAVRWESIVTGDLPDDSTAFGVVDDLLVLVSVAPLDGVGRGLASATVMDSRIAAPALPVIVLKATVGLVLSIWMGANDWTWESTRTWPPP